MRILSINCGSSSVRIAVHDAERGSLSEHARVSCSNVGKPAGRVRLRVSPSNQAENWTYKLESHSQAVHHLLYLLDSEHCLEGVQAVGHRFVHDGGLFDGPVHIGPEQRSKLEGVANLAPLHMPASLVALEAANIRLRQIPHYAVFDTHFHKGMPRVAQNTGLPAAFLSPQVRRFGFHGLSCEYSVHWLRSNFADRFPSRLIVIHLGSGASATAVLDGDSVETTMGFTPISGIPMATRSGDIDFGAALHLADQAGMTVAELQSMLSERSGLCGLSGSSGDMADLLVQAPDDPVAQSAIEYFCYRAALKIAGLTASMRGLDAIVFTGGIGEGSATIRQSICRQLDHLGVELSDTAHEPLISSTNSRIGVYVVRCDENSIIARHVMKSQAEFANPA